MGKKKDADGKTSKSKTKIKIPKQIAGVTIPKSLRDSGKAAIKLAQNPAARELLSAGLVAAAAAVAANNRARKAAMDGGREAADAMGEAAATASDSATKIRAALVGAAEVAAQRFFGLGDDAAKASASDQASATAASPEASDPGEPAETPVVKAAQPKKAFPGAAKPAVADDLPIPPDGA